MYTSNRQTVNEMETLKRMVEMFKQNPAVYVLRLLLLIVAIIPGLIAVVLKFTGHILLVIGTRIDRALHAAADALDRMDA